MYDANGNRTNGSYDTDPGNRLATDGTWNYSYDDEGNLTEKERISDGLTWGYGYDQRNQLVWVEEREADEDLLQRVEFRYDANGNRIEKKVDSDGDTNWDITQRYALDGWKNVNQSLVGNENWDVWADLDGSNSLTTRYIRGDVIDQLFARIEEDAGGGIPYWYLTDHLGSIRDVIDGSAVVKDSITYDGFGNITAETDSNYRGRYAWTGREIDAEIDLQYNRARYYDAATGRWISQDPLGFDAGDSNLFRYTKNRPQATLDPSGTLGFLLLAKRLRKQGIISFLDNEIQNGTPYKEQAGQMRDSLATLYWARGHKLNGPITSLGAFYIFDSQPDVLGNQYRVASFPIMFEWDVLACPDPNLQTPFIPVHIKEERAGLIDDVAQHVPGADSNLLPGQKLYAIAQLKDPGGVNVLSGITNKMRWRVIHSDFPTIQLNFVKNNMVAQIAAFKYSLLDKNLNVVPGSTIEARLTIYADKAGYVGAVWDDKSIVWRNVPVGTAND